MKKNLIILLLTFAIVKLYGQDYYEIDFVGNGATIESINVENTTKGTSVVLDGIDVLHLLLKPESVIDIKKNSLKLKIFPNPMEQSSNIEFINSKQGIANITLYSITGNQIFNYNDFLSRGSHTFCLSGVSSGSYFISVQTETDFFIGKFISLRKVESDITLNHVAGNNSSNSLEDNEQTVRNLKENNETSSIVEMDYDIYDELKFTATANGVGNVVIIDSPLSDKTYTFMFSEMAACGEPFTDPRDGHVYQTVQIGDQCWFAENLKYLPVGEDFDNVTEGSGTLPYYYIYDFNEGGSMDILKNHAAFANYNTYGILYNWSAAMGWDGVGLPPAEGSQCSCPDGWHLPTHDEWTTLEKNVGSDPDAFPYGGATVGFLGVDEGDALKDINAGWCNGTPCGTSGFNALPGGRRYSGGIFYGIGTGTRWWTSTEWGAGAWRRYLEDVQSGVNRFTDYKPFGFSVRCIRD